MASVDIYIYGFVFLLLCGMLLWWWWTNKRFNYICREKSLINNRTIIRQYKGKQFTDSEKITWIMLAGVKDKQKKQIALPPEECIEINFKGKKCFDFYRKETGEVIYIKDTHKVNELPEELFQDIPEEVTKIKEPGKYKEAYDKWKNDISLEWKKKNNIIESYQPVTTKQRVLYINNLRKAESRKGIDWKQQLPVIVSVGAMVLLVLGLMIFWGEIAAPALKANEQAVQINQLQLQQLQVLKEIKTGSQSITGTPPS